MGNKQNDDVWPYTWPNGRQQARLRRVDANDSYVYNETALMVDACVDGIQPDCGLKDNQWQIGSETRSKEIKI